MDRMLVVGCGGFVGAVLRWIVVARLQAWLGGRFPFGTLAVNVLGCFAFGLLAGLALEGQALSPNARLFLFVGVLGGFTTFSAFGYETLALFEAGRSATALLSAAANLVLSVTAVAAGRALVLRLGTA